MKYIKKPIIVEAYKYDGITRFTVDMIAKRLPEWAREAYNKDIIFFEKAKNKDDLDWLCKIRTLEGIHNVSMGDYIIQGVKGEIYPCKPQIFAMTYEPVVEERK